MAEVPTSKKAVAKAAKPVAAKSVPAPAAVLAKPALPSASGPAAIKPAAVAPKPRPVAETVTIPKPAATPKVAVAEKVNLAKPVAAKPAVSAKADAPVKPAVTQAAAAPVTLPKPVAAPAVTPVAAAPVVVAPVVKAPASTPPVAPPVTVAKTEDTNPAVAPAPAVRPNEIAAAIPAAALAEGKSIMNDTVAKVQETISNATKETTERASALFNDVNGRTKAAMEKGTKAIEELVEFSKGNLEAVVASGRVAAKGAEEIAKYSADYGRQSIEKANATAKQFAAIKTPAEFLQLQGDVAKTALDSLVSEGAKFTESYLKLLGEIAQPISNRYAVAAEKVKTVVAA